MHGFAGSRAEEPVVAKYLDPHPAIVADQGASKSVSEQKIRVRCGSQIRRGAPPFTRDVTGRSPLDVLLEQPTVADRELLYWLSATVTAG